ncbi:auxin-responsive protein IAA10-like [Phoenix dactylifera]|uniref:Auxin-responsive protein n=1 Tax=Phoenix dactylifera TaxID=42345 RepID=A0A8B9AXD4_PHODC|nr:auxin-responsive protein IAA10-like [Phoenix dactylifera]
MGGTGEDCHPLRLLRGTKRGKDAAASSKANKPSFRFLGHRPPPSTQRSKRKRNPLPIPRPFLVFSLSLIIIAPPSLTPSTTEEAVEDYVGLSEAASSHPATAEEAAEEGRRDEDEEDLELGLSLGAEEGRRDEDEEDLELGLSLGAKNAARGGGGKVAAAPWGQSCRILTANDFPSLVYRPSPRSSSTSSVSSSSSAALAGGAGGDGVAGTKRAADAVAPDVVGSDRPPSQAVVGWPPIRAFRMNSLFNQSKDNTSGTNSAAHKKTNSSNTNMKEANGIDGRDNKGRAAGCSRFVKVNMDGDPIGRKVDLNAHRSYETLALALELMFHKPAMALSTCCVYGVKASKLWGGSYEFALTYEDKDGDLMLVGDVPWGMFLDTVKRLRIMRTSDARGLSARFQSSNNSYKP